MKKIFQVKAKLLSNKKIKNNYLHCIFNAGKIAKDARPGQFVNIRITDTLDPLLRRPFSIHLVRGSTIEILYEVVGKSTLALSAKKPGEFLDIIGPLGEGFDLERKPGVAILVGGGIGVAPLVFLAKKLKAKKLTLIGAKTKNHIHCEKEFKRLGCKVKVSTDDGSSGFKGYVSELLENLLRAMREGGDRRQAAIYACGPRPMLEKIALISKEKNIPAQISLEEHMACGIGACLGCAVKTVHGYKRICKDGPVFDADKIIF